MTTLGTGVDGSIRRISTAYDVRGMKSKLTSWNDASVSSGDVVNECQFVYNGFSQLVTEYQSHGGSVNTSTSPKVQYGYASGSANTTRATSITYPNGRVISYDYGTSSGINDAISRVDSIKDGSTALAQYSYLGQSAFVITDYTEPDIKWTLADLAGSNDPDTGDIYSGFDRFGRVKDNRWYNYGTNSDVDRIKYGYDRNGNRTYRENTVATANGAKFDELYQNDLLDRLKHMDRGQLTALKDAITDKTFAQCWSLDPTGNWKQFREDDTGDGTWDLEQTRTANPVNEITGISATVGPTWVTPAYNRAGNMTTMPKVADPTVSQTCTYDAWNRLVKVEEGATTISEYQYDAAKRRIIQKNYTSGTLSETRHMYYTEPSKWQVIEERVGTSPDSASAERQFVWGLRYIDDLIVRDRDADHNGTLNERLYAMQDANWNVTAIATPSGTVQERYNYAAYGMPTFLTSTFTSRTSSSFDWETLYCGYRWELGSGIFHVRHRSYHPSLGKWMERDYVGIVAGINLCEYVFSCPLKSPDPYGEAPWVIYVLIILGLYIIVGVPGHDEGCTGCHLCIWPIANQMLESYPGIRADDPLSIDWFLNQQNDAMRHCMVSCESAKQCSQLCSSKVWTAHEKKPNSVDGQMDLSNNAHGRACAYEEDCLACCSRKFKNGDLVCNLFNRATRRVEIIPCNM